MPRNAANSVMDVIDHVAPVKPEEGTGHNRFDDLGAAEQLQKALAVDDLDLLVGL